MHLTKRLYTSTILISTIVAVLFWTDYVWFSLLVALFVVLAQFEFFTLLRNAKVPCFRFFGVAMAAVLPIVVYLEQGSTRSGEVLFLILGCFSLFVLQFTRKSNSEALVGIALTLFGILYVGWFLSFLIKLRFVYEGAYWVAYILAVTKSGDVGAYLIGSLFGKHPLIPHVSPKKSVEGMFGGIVFSAIVSCCTQPYLPKHWSIAHLLILGIMISIVGQIGDLSESLIKRSCQAKDSGHSLPGMGGVLDAVDSVLFTVPLFYFHLVGMNLS